MDDKTFLPLSLAATIAFGLLALAGLLAAGLVMGSHTATVCALMAVGAAYLAQTAATYHVALESKFEALQLAAYALQALSALLFAAGLVALF